MNAEEIEKLIGQISWGHRFIAIKDPDGRERFLIIKALSLHFRNWIEFIYKKSYEYAASNGILTEKDMLVQLGKNGTWTTEDEVVLDNLNKSLVEANHKIKSGELSKRDIQIFNKLIKSTNNKIDELSRRKLTALSNTCEVYAADMRMKAIVFSCVYDENHKRLWDNWDQFQETCEAPFIQQIIEEVSKVIPLDTKTLRAIARSPLWRYRWNAAKSTGDLFGCPISELTDSQSNLVYWSQVYDNVYEAYEKPSDEIINDDEKLDKWFEEQAKKNDEKSKTRRRDAKVNSRVTSSIAKHGEIFIAPNNEAEIKEIYDMNDPLAKKFIQHQDNKLTKHGMLREEELRSDSDSRRVIQSKDNVFSIKRASDGLAKRHVSQVLPGGTIKGIK